MNWFHQLKEFFVFSRSDQNGIIALLFVIVLLLAFRYFLFSESKSVSVEFDEDVQKKITQFESSLHKKDRTTSRTDMDFTGQTDTLFSFDPNTATRHTLETLGWTERQITNLKKYLKAGGAIREKEELKQIYGVSSSFYKKLAPYISLKSQESGKQDTTIGPERNASLKEAESSNHGSRNININRADTTSLKRIKGIGSVFAKRIIKYRELLGGFMRKSQLLEVYGLKESTYNQIKTSIHIDSTALQKMSVNAADFTTLIRHPYLDEYAVKGIMAYRKQQERIQQLSELKANRIVSDTCFKQIKPYLSVYPKSVNARDSLIDTLNHNKTRN